MASVFTLKIKIDYIKIAKFDLIAKMIINLNLIKVHETALKPLTF